MEKSKASASVRALRIDPLAQGMEPSCVRSGGGLVKKHTAAIVAITALRIVGYLGARNILALIHDVLTRVKVWAEDFWRDENDD